MITLFEKTSECCGCSACSAVCPKNAISMAADEKGFLYPSVDESKCVECGMCKRVCPVQTDFSAEKYTQNSYALKNADEKERKSSSSGGVFIELARAALNKGGVVYGASFTEDFKVIHIRAATAEELERLKTSKYVQSDMNNIYRLVKADLVSGIPVLFSGTGCQVQGLKKFLVKPYENLFCVDIICHGVPSQKVFDDYLCGMEKKYKSKAVSVNFRGKTKKNSTKDMLIHFENGKIYSSVPLLDSYYSFFAKDFMLRDSCHKCVFSSKKRAGDITIGDFPGIEKLCPEFSDNKGVSLLITNTPKGEQLFTEVKSAFIVKQTPFEKSAIQQALNHPPAKPQKSEIFWDTYLSKGYDGCVKKLHSLPKLRFFVKNVKLKLKKL